MGATLKIGSVNFPKAKRHPKPFSTPACSYFFTGQSRAVRSNAIEKRGNKSWEIRNWIGVGNSRSIGWNMTRGKQHTLTWNVGKKLWKCHKTEPLPPPNSLSLSLSFFLHFFILTGCVFLALSPSFYPLFQSPPSPSYWYIVIVCKLFTSVSVLFSAI